METANPIQIAKELKILIEYASLPDNIKGYLVRPVRKKIIVINDNLNEQEILIVVAHELVHVLMHETMKKFYTDAKDKYEANLFTLYLLSHSYDIDNRLLAVAPLHRNIMSSRSAHKILCRCLKWGMQAICYFTIRLLDTEDLLSLIF